MLFSKLFAITSKDIPKDCLLKSHKYLVRGGFIKQVSSGLYHFLPLGNIILNKISNIVREEMDKSGAQELSLGFVTPAQLWIESNRYYQYGKELLKFKDRKNNAFVLGPTYEEAMTDCVNSYINSYKQLPINLYQINLKFRDEIRPKFGLMRCKEFIMKDAYSFHESKIDLDREFDVMEQTYKNIFTKIGVDFRVVNADSGAIGGSGSKEFVILAESGEDDIVICSNCNYAANIEIATRAKPLGDSEPPKANFAKFHTLNVDNIDALSDFFEINKFWILQCIVKKAIFANKDSEFCFFFIRGDCVLSNTKALNCIENAIELLDPSSEEIKSIGLFEGYIGPYGLRNITNSKNIIFDKELMGANNLISGANEENYHFIGIDLNTFLDLDYRDVIEVQSGDFCPHCEGKLNITKGIEVGHIFKLGTKYSSSMNASFLDRDGKNQFFEMGCYGIGVSRVMQAILEQKSDEKGAIWGNVAPYSVVIIISNMNNEKEVNYARGLYERLLDSNVNALLDDRDIRFGEKIMDFELIGFSSALIVGKNLENGIIEFIKRNGLKKTNIDSNESINSIINLIEDSY